MPLAPYFNAFSIRFSNTRVSSSRSPGTISGSAGAVISTATSRSRASVCSPSATWRTIGDEIDRRVGPLMRAQLDARQRKQVVDQPRHAPGLRLHDAEEAFARRRIVARRALQRLDEAGERRERRAQLVAGIGDEVGAHLLDPPDRREIVNGDDHDAVRGRPPPVSAAGEMNASEKRVDGSRDENSMRCALPVRLAARIASTSSGMRSAIEAGSPRRSAGAMRDRLGVEGEHAAVLIEHDDRIGHARDDRVEQSNVLRIAGDIVRSPRRKRGVRVFLARAQQAAQPPDPALVGAVIGRRHRAALKNAA